MTTSNGATTSSGVTVLRWSPRVRSDLLTAQAWDALRAADRVLAARPDHPLSAALDAAGVTVQPFGLDPWDDEAAADRLFAAAGTTVWLDSPAGEPRGGSPDFSDALLARGAVELVGSADLPGARVLDLVAVMDRLRSPGGCAWDAEQTHTSLVTYLVEETYETVDAIETDDLAGLREELGDLLLQVVFHARIGEEHTHDRWSLDDVARGITDKLVRRHPHVFGDEDAEGAADAEELEGRWDRLKAAEKGRTSPADGVPMSLPALALASKLHDRANRAGVAPEVRTDLVWAAADDEELGDLLLGVVVLARRAGQDPEAALRAAARRYADALGRG